MYSKLFTSSKGPASLSSLGSYLKTHAEETETEAGLYEGIQSGQKPLFVPSNIND
ncbi:hypothetical protein B4100_1247 [Heyndrickxia coagulans]|nr:hypothetical protein B4100_1247 [Heyndrickxia coagulans]